MHYVNMVKIAPFLVQLSPPRLPETTCRSDARANLGPLGGRKRILWHARD